MKNKNEQCDGSSFDAVPTTKNSKTISNSVPKHGFIEVPAGVEDEVV